MPPQTIPSQVPSAPSSAPAAQRTIHTAQLVTAMLKSSPHVSDLIFSPGRAPQVEVSGQFVELKYKGLECLTPQDTTYIANDIMGKTRHPPASSNRTALLDLPTVSPASRAFRVNIFRQRGSCAVVMRVIPDKIPGFRGAESSRSFQGHRGTCATASCSSPVPRAPANRPRSRPSSTRSTRTRPITSSRSKIRSSSLHRHKKAPFTSASLHTDTPTFALALRAALRQAPKVILVGEMRDRETIEIALKAAETGHLVLLHAPHHRRLQNRRAHRRRLSAFRPAGHSLAPREAFRLSFRSG